MRYEPPSIKQRGQVAKAMNQVQQHRPTHGETTGRIQCPRCGAGLRFTVLANGLSRGQCTAPGCVRWQQ